MSRLALAALVVLGACELPPKRNLPSEAFRAHHAVVSAHFPDMPALADIHFVQVPRDRLAHHCGEGADACALIRPAQAPRVVLALCSEHSPNDPDGTVLHELLHVATGETGHPAWFHEDLNTLFEAFRSEHPGPVRCP